MEEWGSEGTAYFLAQQLSGVFEIEEWQVQGAAARFRGTLLAGPETTVAILRKRLEPHGFSPILPSEREILILPTPAVATPASAERPWTQILLFGATVLTTLLAGALQRGVNPFSNPTALIAGLPFSCSLLSILGVHELGHYFTARRYGVQVTLPYFIPAPPPVILGTFGAFIKMKSPVLDRRSLFDIGIAGPIAGLLLAIPVLMLGLGLSEIVPTGDQAGISLGSSLLFTLVQEMTLGPIPEGMDILLHPVAFAAWIGFFVTALNLLPLGQLDGGHIAYALLGRHSERLAFLTAIGLAILGIAFWTGWLFWAFLAFMLGFKHPPPMNDVTPLDPRRRLLALGALLLLLSLLTPSPFVTPEF
ncbi:MAG: site-2 protease family protein [Candidatus Methylomirabilales bacterium]